MTTAHPDGFLKASAHLLPQYTEKMFALKTNRPITVDDERIPEGSYVLVNPKDKTVSDGRVMIFDLGGGFVLRRCALRGEKLWLMSLADSEPSILHQDDAPRHVVGFASMFLPLP